VNQDQPATWVDTTVANFPCRSLFETQGLLTAIALECRGLHAAGDSRVAFQIYVERILRNPDVDEDVILDAADGAWDAALAKIPFVPLDVVVSSAADEVDQDAEEPVERVAVRKRGAKRLYDALVAHCHEHGLPYHCFGIGNRALAKRLWPDKTVVDRGTGEVGVVDHKGAYRWLLDAIEAGLLVRLDNGKAGEGSKTTQLICLRGSFETLEAAKADGMTRDQYRARVAGEIEQLESQLPLVVASLPAAQPKPEPRVYKETAPVRLLRLARMYVSYLPDDVRGLFPDDTLPGRVGRHLAQHGDDSFALFHEDLLHEAECAAQLIPA
jgi:hypothetical protein